MAGLAAPADPLPRLLDAQAKAWRLVAEAQERGFFAAGQTESVLGKRLHVLARDLLGVRRHWHKRIVRAGPNTLRPYREDPPDLELTDDCIFFLDLGPVFEQWEADIGMTMVLGADPDKHRLAADTQDVWRQGKAWFDSHPEATGRDLFLETKALARDRGWELGGDMAGHLVGRFPHERIPGDRTQSYVHPFNRQPMRGTMQGGVVRHWIYEVHLVDRGRGIGGFFEQLLTGPPGSAEGPLPSPTTRQARLG
ncbi:MAG TPA: M24 family metallopeptidase [Candidatus Thermoplasmatota archaeon]|nr:M24 family metallopeptidase [Candidatus Thermoplasmatota archaeon]